MGRSRAPAVTARRGHLRWTHTHRASERSYQGNNFDGLIKVNYCHGLRTRDPKWGHFSTYARPLIGLVEKIGIGSPWSHAPELETQQTSHKWLIDAKNAAWGLNISHRTTGSYIPYARGPVGVY